MAAEEDEEWKARAMTVAIANFSDPNKAAAESDCCVICQDEVTDPSTTTPCGHRQGCWDCVQKVMYTFGRCAYCREPIRSLTRISTGQIIRNTTDPTKVTIAHPPPPPPPPPTHHDTSSIGAAVAHRRDVYIHGRFSKHIGSNRHSRYREITPQTFRRDPELVSRARKWIRRELLVFSFLHPDNTSRDDMAADPREPGRRQRPRMDMARRRAQNAEFLLEYVIAILKTVDMMGSAGEAENMIAEYLGRDHARLFLHELRSWLRSPFTHLHDWDDAVQYDTEQYPEVPRQSVVGPARARQVRNDRRKRDVVSRRRQQV